MSAVLTVNSAVLFNVTNSGNIPYNSATGLFTLTAGKTYILNAGGRVNAASQADLAWMTSANVELATAHRGGNANVAADFQTTEAIYTPTVNTDVKVAAVGVGTSPQLIANQYWANINQLGSTAITTTTRANVICRGKTVGTSLVSGTWTKNINYIVVQDPTGSMNGVTGLFTAPRTTTYAFTGGGQAPTTIAGQYAGASVYKNGTTQFYNVLISAGGAGLSTYVSTSGTIEMNAGDTLEFRNFNGAATATTSASASDNWFTITEINNSY